jgi:nucleoside-diphosphate-sugar epimerase
MKVFVAGATGAIGRPLVRALVAGGHDVVAMTRSPGKTGTLRQLGAEPVVADGLDKAATVRAVTQAEPEVVIHQLTSVPADLNYRRFDESFAATNRLRTEGTDNLLEAARAAGARRIIAQSYAPLPYVRAGRPIKTEDDPLEENPPARMHSLVAAIRYLEAAVTGAEGIEGVALRYGGFYGPDTSLAEDGAMVRMLRKRMLPVIGDGAGVFSFVHVNDAAAATVAALDRGAPGVYNVVDDEPAPAAVWVPELAKAVGAKPPLRIPVWVGRLAAGEVAVFQFTQLCGVSNAKAKRELGLRLQFPSWREGFRHDLSVPPHGVARSA